MFDDIPDDCKHRGGGLHKDCCRIVCSSCDYIVEHDKCVNNGGCDAIAINAHEKVTYIIECKHGRFGSADAEDAVRQLRKCVEYYKRESKGFNTMPIILYGKKVDSYAREYIIRAGHELKRRIRMHRCGKDLSTIL